MVHKFLKLWLFQLLLKQNAAALLYFWCHDIQRNDTQHNDTQDLHKYRSKSFTFGLRLLQIMPWITQKKQSYKVRPRARGLYSQYFKFFINYELTKQASVTHHYCLEGLASDKHSSSSLLGPFVRHKDLYDPCTIKHYSLYKEKTWVQNKSKFIIKEFPIT